jgi:hypothetical protein
MLTNKAPSAMVTGSRPESLRGGGVEVMVSPGIQQVSVVARKDPSLTREWGCQNNLRAATLLGKCVF